jgi:transcriptional regulator with XRE-family HTH domain
MAREDTVGKRLRAARLRRQLRLREVASKAGITASALSQLERDQFNPTVETLKSVATALSITIGSLFATTPAADRIVVHPDSRKLLSPRKGITYELLTHDLSGQIQFFISVYEAGAMSGEETFAYPAEQVGLMLQGIADVQLGDSVHRLRAGDSIRFDCSIPHRIVNIGRSRMRCLWAITPPSF